MPKLTDEQIKISHAWLHDIFVWGGLLTTNKRDPAITSTYRDKSTMYGILARIPQSPLNVSAHSICDFVINRPMKYQDFKDVDLALAHLEHCWFVSDLTATRAYNYWIRKKAPMLAKYLANFLHENGIYWNNLNSTSYEMDEIKKTIIGKALFDFGCFASQYKKPGTKVAKTSSTKQAGQAPQNSYKASGAQSSKVINLVGQPGQKLFAQVSVCYCIEADKTASNVPNAFIKPLDAKYNQNNVAQVLFGSGNGYTDCKCWFDDLNDANNFLAQVQTKFGSTFNNIHISKAKADKNGYFIVKTEFGNCAIKASKLNEELQEEAEIKEEKSSFELNESNIEAYADAFYKYE